jgi:hypothetical protein
LPSPAFASLRRKPDANELAAAIDVLRRVAELYSRSYLAIATTMIIRDRSPKSILDAAAAFRW